MPWSPSSSAAARCGPSGPAPPCHHTVGPGGTIGRQLVNSADALADNRESAATQPIMSVPQTSPARRVTLAVLEPDSVDHRHLRDLREQLLKLLHVVFDDLVLKFHFINMMLLDDGLHDVLFPNVIR